MRQRNNSRKYLLLLLVVAAGAFFSLWWSTKSEAYSYAIDTLYAHEAVNSLVGNLQTTFLIGSRSKSMSRSDSRGTSTVSCAQFNFYARGEKASKFIKIVMKADPSTKGHWRIIGIARWDDSDLTCSA